MRLLLLVVLCMTALACKSEAKKEGEPASSAKEGATASSAGASASSSPAAAGYDDAKAKALFAKLSTTRPKDEDKKAIAAMGKAVVPAMGEFLLEQDKKYTDGMAKTKSNDPDEALAGSAASIEARAAISACCSICMDLKKDCTPAMKIFAAATKHPELQKCACEYLGIFDEPCK